MVQAKHIVPFKETVFKCITIHNKYTPVKILLKKWRETWTQTQEEEEQVVMASDPEMKHVPAKEIKGYLQRPGIDWMVVVVCGGLLSHSFMESIALSNILSLELWSIELQDDSFLLIKPLSLWCWVRKVQQTQVELSGFPFFALTWANCAYYQAPSPSSFLSWKMQMMVCVTEGMP